MTMLADYLAILPAPENEKRFVDKSMQLSGLISDAMQRSGLTQRALAEKLGKKESEISKWLSGLHNFTLKTLTRLEAVLGEDLILTFRDNQIQEVQLASQRGRRSATPMNEVWLEAPFQNVAVNTSRRVATTSQVGEPSAFSLCAA